MVHRWGPIRFQTTTLLSGMPIALLQVRRPSNQSLIVRKMLLKWALASYAQVHARSHNWAYPFSEYLYNSVNISRDRSYRTMPYRFDRVSSNAWICMDRTTNISTLCFRLINGFNVSYNIHVLVCAACAGHYMPAFAYSCLHVSFYLS